MSAMPAEAFLGAARERGFGLFTGAALGRLFVRTAEFHFTEDAFALHFLFQRLQGLIDIVIANGDLHGRFSLFFLSVR